MNILEISNTEFVIPVAGGIYASIEAASIDTSTLYLLNIYGKTSMFGEDYLVSVHSYLTDSGVSFRGSISSEEFIQSLNVVVPWEQSIPYIQSVISTVLVKSDSSSFLIDWSHNELIQSLVVDHAMNDFIAAIRYNPHVREFIRGISPEEVLRLERLNIRMSTETIQTLIRNVFAKIRERYPL